MFANAQFRNLLPVRAGGLKPGRKFSDVIDSIADLLSLDTSVSLLSEVPVRQTATWTRKDGTEVLGEVRPLPSGGMH